MFVIARFVFNLALENKVVVSITAHPSQIQVEDLEVLTFDHTFSLAHSSDSDPPYRDFPCQKYAQTSKAALLINTCTHDPQFPPEKIEAADRLLGAGKTAKATTFEPGYERAHWEGCTHGFAVRGDMVRLSCLRLRCWISSSLMLRRCVTVERSGDQGGERGGLREECRVP